MKIKVIKIPENKEKTYIDLVFIDDDIKEIAGHCKYSIKNKIGEISDAYLYPNYRKKKIMSTYIDNILCDMKCMGAKKIRLFTLLDEERIIWEKFGFHQIDEKGNMEIDLSNKECKCLSTLHSFINELDISKLIENTYK